MSSETLVIQANNKPSNTTALVVTNTTAKAAANTLTAKAVLSKNEEAKAVAKAAEERTKIFKILYPLSMDNGDYSNFFEIQRLARYKDKNFSKNLLNLLQELEDKKKNSKPIDRKFNRYLFNLVDLLYKSYINAGPRLSHIHDLSEIKECPSNNRHLCDVCDIINTGRITSPQKYLCKYRTCNECGYDECLKCYRKSDREKHEHTPLTPTGWARRPNEYVCTTCGRFADGGSCWECEECKKENKTYVECYVCHNEPTKDQTVLPNIVDGTNVIVTNNNNKTASLVVRPANSINLPAGGKRRHTKRKRHQSRNHTKRNHN